MRLETRTGINTGEVAVGAGEVFASGDAVNVAARLEQSAAPGEILISESTRALVRGAVDVEAAGPLELKGKAAPVEAWRLRGLVADDAVRAAAGRAAGRPRARARAARDRRLRAGRRGACVRARHRARAGRDRQVAARA